MIGQAILVRGTASNNESYIIANVTPLTLTLKPEFSLVQETSLAATITGDVVLPDDETVLDMVFPFIDSAPVSFSKATSNVTVIGNSIITTSGDVSISSLGESKATPFFPGLGYPSKFTISAVWAETDATAKASVEGTSRITAGGKLTVKADTLNEVSANTLSLSRNRPLDLTFAGARTNADTDAFLGAGTVIRSAGLDVLANTKVDVQVGASVANSGGSGLGMAAAYNELTTDTDAYIAGSVVSTAGDVTVLANVVTENFLTDADSRHTGSTKIAGTQVANNISKFSNESARRIGSIAPGDAKSSPAQVIDFLFPQIRSGSLNLSGAIVVALTEQTVDAYIAPNALVDSQSSVTVLATLSDRTGSSAASEATSDGKSIGGVLFIRTSRIR